MTIIRSHPPPGPVSCRDKPDMAQIPPNSQFSVRFAHKTAIMGKFLAVFRVFLRLFALFLLIITLFGALFWWAYANMEGAIDG
jgi:hypothetical protein